MLPSKLFFVGVSPGSRCCENTRKNTRFVTQDILSHLHVPPRAFAVNVRWHCTERGWSQWGGPSWFGGENKVPA